MEIIIKCSDENRGSKNIYGKPIQEVVRCKDCKWHEDNFCGNFNVIGFKDDDYCSLGRKERRCQD